MSDERPMAERIEDPAVREWLVDRELSDDAADRCRRVVARWRRERRSGEAS